MPVIDPTVWLNPLRSNVIDGSGTVTAVLLDNASLAGARFSLRDVTARKQAELELKTAYEQIGNLKDQLEAENTYYRAKIQQVDGASALIGGSDPMKYLQFRISQVAPSNTTSRASTPFRRSACTFSQGIPAMFTGACVTRSCGRSVTRSQPFPGNGSAREGPPQTPV